MRVRGVKAVISGYAGGGIDSGNGSPRKEEMTSGKLGHVAVV